MSSFARWLSSAAMPFPLWSLLPHASMPPIGLKLAAGRSAPDIVRWEVGGGQAPRQPGQVRKEAAATSSGLGRSSGLPLAPGLAMTDSATSYRVLARKYRPQTFAEVIGQEAMVRTLSNAIAEGRIAQAFILTGVRGVGKTTTARIIARAPNCIGADGTGAPTLSPCGHCGHCP